jgi:hypothetical protein
MWDSEWKAYFSSSSLNALPLSGDHGRLVEGEGLGGKNALLRHAHNNAGVTEARNQHEVALDQHSGHGCSAVLHSSVSKLIELFGGGGVETDLATVHPISPITREI